MTIKDEWNGLSPIGKILVPLISYVLVADTLLVTWLAYLVIARVIG